jgi:hypothetical protein
MTLIPQDSFARPLFLEEPPTFDCNQRPFLKHLQTLQDNLSPLGCLWTMWLS